MKYNDGNYGQPRSVTVDPGNNKSNSGSREIGNGYDSNLKDRSKSFYSNKHLHNTNNGHQLPRGKKKNLNNVKPRSITVMNERGEIETVVYTPPKIDPTNPQVDNPTQNILKTRKLKQQMNVVFNILQEEKNREARLYGARKDLIEGNVHPSEKNYRIAPHLLNNYRKNNNEKGNLNIRNQSANPSGSQFAAKLGYTRKFRSTTTNSENQFAKTPNNKDNSLFSTFNNTSSQNTFYKSNLGSTQSTQPSIEIDQSSIGLPSITPKLTKSKGSNEQLIPPVFKRLDVPSKNKVGQGNLIQEMMNDEKTAQLKKKSEQQELKGIEKRIIKFATPLMDALNKLNNAENNEAVQHFSETEIDIVKFAFYLQNRNVSENIYTPAEENELRDLDLKINEMIKRPRRMNYLYYPNSDVVQKSSNKGSNITKNLQKKQIPILNYIERVKDTDNQIKNLNLFVPNVSSNLNENINGNIKKPSSYHLYHRRVKNKPINKE